MKDLLINHGITVALGVLSAWLGRLLRKNKKKADLLEPVIRGVELAGGDLVKSAIRTQATRAGVQTDLHQEVKRVTDPRP